MTGWLTHRIGGVPDGLVKGLPSTGFGSLFGVLDVESEEQPGEEEGRQS